MLLITALLFAKERRVAEHKAGALGGQDFIPVEAQRIVDANVRRARNREAHEVVTELRRERAVGVVVHQVERRTGNAGRELLDFDTVELVHRDAQQLTHVEDRGAVAEQAPQDFSLEAANLSIGDNEEVATATSRIKERQ